MSDWSPLWIGLRVAALSTAIAVASGPWLGFLLKRQADWLIGLPLSLSPVLLFGYFLVVRESHWTTAALVASAFSLPYVLCASAAAFGSLNPGYLNAARGLGASEWRIFWRIAGPLAWRPILRAAASVFATVGAGCSVALVLTGKVDMGAPVPVAPLAATGLIALAIHYLGIRIDRDPGGRGPTAA